mmetsp:Transcript_30569/g.40654  ORF Transcript_30569/g.40654 Transcript_30569/m.40654 type:complete len:201 (+) Transcript_30569:1190-1792(+)
MAPDHLSYETIDTTEIRRRLNMIQPRPQSFGPPLPVPPPLLRMLAGAGVPPGIMRCLPGGPPCGMPGGPKPMFMVIKRVIGGPRGPGGPDGPVKLMPRPSGPPSSDKPSGPSKPSPELLRRVIADKITQQKPVMPHPEDTPRPAAKAPAASRVAAAKALAANPPAAVKAAIAKAPAKAPLTPRSPASTKKVIVKNTKSLE